LIDDRFTVTSPLTARDLTERPDFAGQEFDALRGLATLFADMHSMWDVPMAVEVSGLPKQGYRLGAGVRVVTGAAAGRQLWCINGVANVLLCDSEGEASNVRFTAVLSGDEVHIDNHAFLAYCYYYRHHLMESVQWECLKIDGKPLYEQYPLPTNSPFMGVPYSGQFSGKLMWIHHSHDASLWPPSGIGYKDAIERVQGDAAGDHFRIRWTENAEHISPMMLPTQPGRATNTWLIDYLPIIDQSLADLAAWVEDGVEPGGTTFSYDYRDALVTLPTTAAERGGIQPVVRVTANGGQRAEVGVGEPVQCEVIAEVPSGAGTVISIEWDFDGSGAFPEKVSGIDGTAPSVTSAAVHAYDRPGTYFVTALVHAHRDGDIDATCRRVPNLAQARVVVT
jgi:hypothetical protein